MFVKYIKTLLLVAVGIIIITGSYLLYRGREMQQNNTGPIDKLTVGTITEYALLIRVAQDQGFFRKNNLEVRTIEHTSGATAFSDLFRGTADIVNAADFLAAQHSFTEPRFKIIATIARSRDVFELAARTDHNIHAYADLKGKKIGVTKKTSGEYWLGTFLTLHGLSSQDVTLVDLTPQQLEEALTNGTIDAMMTFEPHVFNVRKKINDSIIVWPGQSDRDLYSTLFATTSTLNQRPEVVARFVRALTEAEDFLANNPKQISANLTRLFSYDPTYISTVASRVDYHVALDQALLLALDHEARWMIDNHLTTTSTLPNFLDFVYVDGLNTVRPSAIQIVR